MSRPTLERELARERARQQRHREGGQQTDLSDRMSSTPPWLEDGADLTDLFLEHDDLIQTALTEAGVQPDTAILDEGDQPELTFQPSPQPIPPVGVGGVASPANNPSVASTPTPPDDPLAEMHRLTSSDVAGPSAPNLQDTLDQLHAAVRQRPSPPPAAAAAAAATPATPRPVGRPPLRPRPNSNAEMVRTLELLREDENQRLQGRNIHGITHTNTITTVYKDNRDPQSQRISTRTAGGRTVSQARQAERQRRMRRRPRST